MIETLNHLQPVIIIGSLIFFFTLETFLPNAMEYSGRNKHAMRNLMLTLFCFLMNGIGGTWLGFWLVLIQQHQLGLLNVLHLNLVTTTVFGVLLLDFESYVLHQLSHKIPLLWRFHRVHHSDNQPDSTSSLRIHPLETFFQIIWHSMAFAVFGISFTSFILYNIFLLPLLFVQHANIQFPSWLEKPLGLVLVTSSWHKVHHSDEQSFTDSHYGNLFTFWDRIFGTSHQNVAINKLNFGLKELKEDKDQTVVSQLALPFKSLK